MKRETCRTCHLKHSADTHRPSALFDPKKVALRTMWGCPATIQFYGTAVIVGERSKPPAHCPYGFEDSVREQHGE